MPENLLIQFCSPTLAGLKTGNIFTASYESMEVLLEDVRRMNALFSKKGIRVTSLRYRDGNALIYVYRPGRLQKDLQDAEARRILIEKGYAGAEGIHVLQNECIRTLSERLEDADSFPHEIGLFIGYPSEDVRGFMEEGSRACKMTGCWKVYGDTVSAQKKFSQFRKCTGVYWKCWKRGVPMERLAVTVR